MFNNKKLEKTHRCGIYKMYIMIYEPKSESRKKEKRDQLLIFLSIIQPNFIILKQHMRGESVKISLDLKSHIFFCFHV